jgi:hypothetical protein
MFDDEYVQLKTRKCVAFVRVEPLMDRALLAGSLRAMLRERNLRPRWDARYDAQWVWDDYCERHADHYGELFRPDVDPDWDASSSTIGAAAPPNPK